MHATYIIWSLIHIDPIQHKKLNSENFKVVQLCTSHLCLIKLIFWIDPIPRMKPLSCPSQFSLWKQRAVKNNFQKKYLFHKCSSLAFERVFVAAATTVYQQSHFWKRLRTEGQELFAFRFDQKNSHLNPFLEFIADKHRITNFNGVFSIMLSYSLYSIVVRDYLT